MIRPKDWAFYRSQEKFSSADFRVFSRMNQRLEERRCISQQRIAGPLYETIGATRQQVFSPQGPRGCGDVRCHATTHLQDGGFRPTAIISGSRGCALRSARSSQLANEEIADECTG